MNEPTPEHVTAFEAADPQLCPASAGDTKPGTARIGGLGCHFFDGFEMKLA